MKILKRTAAWIDSKLYKEGSSIPSKNEKEFEKYLVEVPDPKEKPVTPKPKDKEAK